MRCVPTINPLMAPVSARVVDRRRIVSRVFASVAASAPMVRSWTRDHLQRLGVGSDVTDRVELLVSEVATNAVRHTTSPRFIVQLDVDSEVQASVRDDDPGHPQVRHPRPWDNGGRGMHRVEALADAWGTRAERQGKWVWFRVERPSTRADVGSAGTPSLG